MRKSSLMIAPLLLFIILLSCNNKKSPAGPAYSYDIADSKLKDVFLFEVTCDKPAFFLDKQYKCKIESAWFENSWNKQVMVFGPPKVLKFDSLYQLVLKLKIEPLPIKKNNDTFYFIGGQLLDSMIDYRYLHTISDTTKVPVFKQINSEHLSQKQKAFDTLIFIRRPNNT